MGDPERGAVGRFRVVSRLGHDVLLGVDEAGRQAVVRLLPDATGEAARARLRRDVQLAAAAPPWFAAPVLDADTEADPPWIATAHVPGPTLARYVGEHGPLNGDGVFALATRMLDGLVALHDAGIAHHNLDPGTVLLADDGPRVTDTGISSLPVTAPYRAPEAGDPGAGPPADMYAFGALLAFSTTARAPAPDASGEIDLDPLTGRVRDGVLGCLQTDWALRPTAAQLREYLRAGLLEAAAEDVGRPTERTERTASAAAAPTAVEEPVFARSGPPAARRVRRVPGVAIGAAVVLVVALIAGGMLLFGGRSGTGAHPAPAASGPPVTTSTTTAAPSPSSSAVDPAAGATVTDAAADPRFTPDGARFVSPSHNITCSLTAREARCDVLERSWSPGEPADCGEATGVALVGERARAVCAPVPAAADEVLAYDTGVRLGDVVCVSRESGMECRSSAGSGFRASRAAYSLY